MCSSDLDASGAAWCWGRNKYGEVGDGTTIPRPRARKVVTADGTPLANVTQVSVLGPFGCARTSGGAAWCWGLNDVGRLGDGTTTDRDHAVRVKRAGGGFLQGVAEVSAGSLHGCARLNDGTAWCWGYNYRGELGDGTKTMRLFPVKVTRPGVTPFLPIALSGVTSISAGNGQTCAATDAERAFCWGWNEFGQVGDGTTVDRTRAREVKYDASTPFGFVTTVSTNQTLACAMTGSIGWCWGWNKHGGLGDGTTVDRHYATQVTVVP